MKIRITADIPLPNAPEFGKVYEAEYGPLPIPGREGKGYFIPEKETWVFRDECEVVKDGPD